MTNNNQQQNMAIKNGQQGGSEREKGGARSVPKPDLFVLSGAFVWLIKPL